VRAWLQYALSGAVIVAVVAFAITRIVAMSDVGAVWFGAGLSYVLQLGAFAALLTFRRNAQLFLLGWAFGIGLRFLAVVVVAFWLTKRAVFPMEPALLSMVGFLMLLVLMEPLFLRRGTATK
jgi:hypothetical protein